jgi:hypothetical protein
VGWWHRGQKGAFVSTQHILNVINEWPTQDLLTLDETKVQLRIPASDMSKDVTLTLAINGVSAQMAVMANRVFGYAKVRETFYDVHGMQRLYFSRWPVKLADIETMTLDGIDLLATNGWVLEEKTGTLYTPPSGGRIGWNGDLDVVYSGGYKLPDEAPDDLKRAAAAAAREDYYTYIRGTVLSGVRMISHKGARVQYYPPGQMGTTTQGTGKQLGPVWTAVANTLSAYTRHWI